MAKITKIGVMSLAKILAIIGFFVGIILGIVYAIGVAAMGAFQNQPIYYVVSLVLLFLVPVAMTVISFLQGLIIALCFNYGAKRIGGLEVQIQK